MLAQTGRSKAQTRPHILVGRDWSFDYVARESYRAHDDAARSQINICLCVMSWWWRSRGDRLGLDGVEEAQLRFVGELCSSLTWNSSQCWDDHSYLVRPTHAPWFNKALQVCGEWWCVWCSLDYIGGCFTPQQWPNQTQRWGLGQEPGVGKHETGW